MKKLPSEIKREREIIKRKVEAWKHQAIEKLAEMPATNERVQLALKYLRAHKSSSNRATKWPEIEQYLQDKTIIEDIRKEQREELIKLRHTCELQHVFEKDVGLPTLEQYKKLYGPYVSKETGRTPEDQAWHDQRMAMRKYWKTFNFDPNAEGNLKGNPKNLTAKQHDDIAKELMRKDATRKYPLYPDKKARKKALETRKKT